ncbi:hypothetical protein TrLO_g12826 [Triparma laevis f. longispina]|uniref:WDR36/Utp21 C-terminal domain-containing protein n=1 Tax=Triparma laevis f. longispina TaxID=1714387 RepID=A0A9W7AR38_9STRA|nr:hypothetical protein TrLO_g12826 [Triparma laevis f. longispina]
MTFKSPPTSLTVSTTGEFLATSHADSKGISLWADKSFYQTVHLTGPPAVSTLMDDPSPGGGEEEDEEQEINESPAKTHSDVVGKAKLDDDADEEEDGGPVVPKGVGMVTLSGLPDGHWKNLFHLELVKLRNKPKEAPKKPESAPFFLQRRGDGGTGLDMIVDEKVEEIVTEYLQSMGPSAIDVAMTTLCSGEHDCEGIDFLVLFVEYLGTAAETRENFEAFNAYLNRFLFVHADLLRAAEQGGGGAGGERRMAQMKRMKEAMEKLRESQAGAANRLKEKLTKASALVKHFQSLI